jgi:hypothetical protein
VEKKVFVVLPFGSLAMDSNAMNLPSRLIRRPKEKITAVVVGSGLAVGVALGTPFFVLVACRKPLTAPVAGLKFAT